MDYVWSALVGFASFFVGIFGFYQIIGSIRLSRFRSVKLTFFTVIFWLIILGGIAALVHFLIPEHRVAYYIGTGISFLMSLGAGTKQQDIDKVTK